MRTRVFGGVSPKTFKGAIMTGPLMVELLTAAVAAVNKPGGVLNVGSMWSALLDAELKNAAAAAQDSYKAVAKAFTTCRTPQQAEKVNQVRVSCIAALALTGYNGLLHHIVRFLHLVGVLSVQWADEGACRLCR